MARRSHTQERIVKKLREVLSSQGSSAGEATRKIGVVEQTHCADGENMVG